MIKWVFLLAKQLGGVDKGIIQVQMRATLTQKRRCGYLRKRNLHFVRTCITSFTENSNSIKRFRVGKRTSFRELKSRQLKNIGDEELIVPQFLVG